MAISVRARIGVDRLDLAETMVDRVVDDVEELAGGWLADYRVRSEYDGVDGRVSAIVTTRVCSKHRSRHFPT